MIHIHIGLVLKNLHRKANYLLGVLSPTISTQLNPFRLYLHISQ
jgi:hypothetical protein